MRVQLVRSHFLEPLLAPLIKWMKLQARGLNKGTLHPPNVPLIPNGMGNIGILIKFAYLYMVRLPQILS